ncbi:MAG: FlgD immunoglobulin-like domain containing protein [Candidatus Krumholzibacteriota bacterium]
MKAIIGLAGMLAFVSTAVAPVSAQEPNLTYKYDPSMTYPLTPTNIVPAPIPITVPATLPGNAHAIYFNLSGQNNGAASTVTPISGTFKLDGDNFFVWNQSSAVNAGATYFNYNNGALNVRGGRHTLEVVHDDPDLVQESDETDNWWAHQFVFTPYVLSVGTPKIRGTPPMDDGGTTSIIDGSPIYSNCDGFRFTSTGWWNAVTLYAASSQADYDLELFNPSTGSENGFIGGLAFSYGLNGYLDALFVNRNTVGVNDYDVGVTKSDNSTGQFVIEQVVSESAWVGMKTTATFGADEYLKIWDTYIGDTGWVTVAVDDSLRTGIPFRVGWIDKDATVVGMSDVPGWVTYGEIGEIRMSHEFTATGYYGLVLHRHQYAGGQAVDQTLVIEPTPPDPRPWDMPGWHSSLVPTPMPITAGMFPVLPDTLHGYAPRTYLNFAVYNFSNTGSPAVDVAVYRDGIIDSPVTYLTPPLGPLDIIGTNDTSAEEFPGGRHTLTVETDYTQSIHEILESNNHFGEQYCWSPLELRPGQQNSRPGPGPASGGWETVGVGHVLHYNCDGYRIPTGYNEFEGMVLTQGPNSDYDLVIHTALDGVKDGFDDYLGGSARFLGQTDYVVFNNHRLPSMLHDIGVENFQGDEPYTIEAVGSNNLPVPVSGRYGPFTMPVSNMLHLYNIYLEADVHAFRLDNLAGTADWELALHPNNVDRIARTQVLGSALSNRTGPGGAEWFTENITTAGYYCLAVCKTGPFEFDKEGSYQLTILQGISDVTDEPDLPSATALTGVFPNPFNPQTTISYELAARAEVELEIYDVKGALVRRLVDGAMPAGRHAAVWNGTDDAGRRVASGVYLATFHAGLHRDVHKLVVVK